jgi:glycosyltransferase involved in cell wall biosynthesis
MGTAIEHPESSESGNSLELPKISIVTLSFNQAPYLREALDSVLSQAYAKLEYIVVDPGSTDGSRDLIDSYFGRIAVKLFQPDRGPADGLNKGFQLATGDVYGFLNADDVLFPDSLHRVGSFFQAHPECDILMASGCKIDAQGVKLRRYRAHDFTTQRFFYGGCEFLQQATFFRSGTFRRSKGFNVENRTSWDGELFLDMAHSGARIAYLDDELGGFRIHEQSISGSGRLNAQYRRDCRRMFRDLNGRNWDTRDEILRLLFRTQSVVKRIRRGF